VPAVDDRRLPGVGALEEEEVVADQLHLVQRLADGHGRGGMMLLPDDAAGQVFVEIGDVRPLGELAVQLEGTAGADVGAGVAGDPDTGRGAPAVVHAAAGRWQAADWRGFFSWKSSTSIRESLVSNRSS
jgi:hypothetical protein